MGIVHGLQAGGSFQLPCYNCGAHHLHALCCKHAFATAPKNCYPISLVPFTDGTFRRTPWKYGFGVAVWMPISSAVVCATLFAMEVGVDAESFDASLSVF